MKLAINMTATCELGDNGDELLIMHLFNIGKHLNEFLLLCDQKVVNTSLVDGNISFKIELLKGVKDAS